ncbi:hypothetical protein [Pantoea coffeiphila]|uniref:hypothetical protein n=1 Tax=Pantoea coffeiphila TaxID=1465635 RepID=UPI0019600556|nr:hypothetical protein [Pantoea coffeiphila]MBM7342475.1 hypothetical protein [Pantoea coffeiphila]
MKVHRVDYRLVPGLTHAMAGALLPRECSADTLISPSIIGSAIDHDACTGPRFTAQRTALTACLPYQSETNVGLSDRVDADPQIQYSELDLRIILRNGYCRLARVVATAGKYVKPGRIYSRIAENNVSFSKLFSHPPYLNMGK